MTKRLVCVLVALACAFTARSAFAVCPAGPPALTSPGNGAQVPFGNVVLNWNPVAGAAEYQVWLALDGSPFGLHDTVTTTQKLLNVEAGRTVQWKVVATAPSCAAMISPIFVFTTACPAGQPVIQSPARGAEFRPGQNVTFTWTPLPGAVSYDVNVTADFGQTHTAVAQNITTNTFTTTFREGDWGWHVRANFDGSCPPAFSEPSHFEVVAERDGCPSNPGKPTLIAPAANATNLVSPVSFSWTAVSGARGYRVLVARDPGGLVQVAETTDTKASVNLPAGSAFWLVYADFGEGCAPTLSERRAFTVTQGTTCTSTPPQLLSPANNSIPNASRVTFQWGAVTGATAYELWVATGGDGNFALYGLTDARTTELERFVPNDIVDWYVVARRSGCPDVRSTTFRLGAATACNLGAVTLTSPANGANVTSPVTLAWNAVQGASEYRITLRAGDSSIVTRTTTTTTAARLPVGTYAWRVEALRGDCSSESQERTFTVGRAANCDANVASTLVAPAGTEAQPARATSPVTLQWTAAPNALGYRVWLSRNGQPFEDVALTAATTKQLELDEPGKYAWFVNALFEGCDPKRSNVAWFEIADTTACSTTAPAVIAPAAGQIVSGRVLFQWSAVPGAGKYRVIAIVDGKPVLLGTTTDTQLERVLQPGPYTYTIEAVFEECRSTFSPRTSFVVEREQLCATEAPAVVSPANGATVNDAEVTFVWTPVSGAIRYAVVAQVEDGTETLLGATEETSLTHRVPAGRITWRVLAFFASCDAETSPRATFTRTRPQGNCNERKPVLLFPNGDRVVPAPVQLTWLGVPDAEEYRIWIQRGTERPSVAATTAETFAEVNVPQGPWRWFVEARFANCPPAFSAVGEFTAGAEAACGTPRKPDAQAVGRALSGTSYHLRWMPLPRTARYEVQESTAADFANAQTFFTSRPFLTFTHTVTGAPVEYFYRVRALSACNDTPGPFSDVVGVFVIDATTNSSTTELGGDADAVVQKIFVPGGTTPVQFTARVDKPWLMVTPTSGTLPPAGITLTVTADPNVLKPGTNTGTVQLTYSSAARGGIGTNDGPTQTNFPMSVSLVTPVMPEGKGTPPPDALIFPAVGHAAGANDSLFESDVRLTNLSAQTVKYDLYFTPSGVDGTENSHSTTIEVSPQETVALDDVVANVFGDGTAGSAIGMLEVRPVETSQSSGDFFGSIAASAVRQLQTAASSRTYNFTPNGTFGQFIPAIPFAQFAGRGAILSLQQVAQSSQFRANFGFLEASGNPADLIVRVYDTANTLLTSFPLSLRAMEHRQFNGLLQQHGITSLTDGRVEVEVVSGDGKVSAYVSEVDNATNDPLMVSPVIKGEARADRWVVPGMASLRSGSAFWVSDLRIFNAGDTSTPAMLTFYPMGNPGGAISRPIALEPGEIEVLNNVLVNHFGLTADAGGSVVITTPSETSLVATARTYNQTSTGTYGQFIPGVTVAESIGVEDRALQVLQVEQSSRFRTNIGVNETSGKPVTIEVSLIVPDSFVTPVVTLPLAANEFRQIGLVDFALDGAVYNGRVTVKVIAGEGRVTAYGSAIDAITQDPTYVPAQ